MTAIAISNNDTVLISWSVDAKIRDCIGFTIHRIDEAGHEEPLPAYVGFEKDSNPNWQPKNTDIWPIQKFSWKDLEAKPGGKYRYKIIALRGPSPNPKPMPGKQPLVTNQVEVTADRDGASVYFNRGLISTQATTRDLMGGNENASLATLLKRIAQDGDSIRTRLAGQMPAALLSFLDRAKNDGGGKYYAALYELTDPVLIAKLLSLKNLHIILSNADKTDGKKTLYDEENAPVRQAFRDGGHDLTSRLMPEGHIGHDKFIVYVDKKGNPEAVLTGSTNWTSTALCTQSNNAIIIESLALAKRYVEFWLRLKADTEAAIAASGDVERNPSLQGADLRTKDQVVNAPVDMTKGSVQVWFSPNTKQKSKSAPKKGSTKPVPTPIDMQSVFEILHGADQAVLFLAFQPGNPSIISELEHVVAEREKAGKRPLFIRGALTDPNAAREFDTTVLFHRSLEVDASVIGVAGVPEQFAFWQRELYKAGHAVIHDKVMVIDPLDEEKCVVITGSHNLGFRASYNNDENLLIIRGNPSVAQAYATHVMDVYDHYRWRWYQSPDKTNPKRGASTAKKPAPKKPPSWTGLFESSDDWQNKYFEVGHLARLERLFWVGQLGKA